MHNLQAREIKEAFLDFKREILRAAENSRTGKPLPPKLIKGFEEQEQSKDSEVRTVRSALVNILATTHYLRVNYTTEYSLVTSHYATRLLTSY